MLNNKISVIITAAGNSSRFGQNKKKEYLPISKNSCITVLSEVVFKFLQTKMFSSIVIVIPNKDQNKAKNILNSDYRISSLENIQFVAGGKTRQESVFNGLNFLNENETLTKPDFILIHDAARPFVSNPLIMRTVENVITYDAVAPVIAVTDTQKQVSNANWIEKHLTRSKIKAVQTPQAFNFKKILNAHKMASKDGKTYTDETEIFDKYEGKVFTCEGSLENKKITFSNDLPKFQQHAQPYIYKTGLGYDLHKLKKGKPLILGGLKLDSTLGCEAHSDGDVLLHAITDSLLGATGFSDIGELFPPSDFQWKNANSSELLKMAWNKCKADWEIGNIDCVIAIESPKILPYRKNIINSIAKILEIPSENVFVKAKTGEGIGIIGNKEAVAVWVTSLIYRSYQISPE